MHKEMESLGADKVSVALREITKEGRMPAVWKCSLSDVLYGGLRDAPDCSNHSGMTFL